MSEHACSVHTEQLAGWQCSNDGCRHYLCGECTAQLLKLFTCCACGGPARPLTVSRKTKSRAHWLAAAGRYPFGAGLASALTIAFALAAVAIVARLVESNPHQLDGVVTIARACLLAGYALVTIDRTVRSGETGVLLRLARILAGTLIIWLPAVAYVALLGASRAAHDWAIWLLAGLALSYLPVVLATAVTDTTFGSIANPFHLFESIFRLRRIYPRSLIAMLAFAGLSAAGALLAPAIQRAIPTPLLGDAIAQLPLLAGLAMTGHVIGMLAHVHGDLLGWGSAELFVDRLFPDMVASGRRKIAARPGESTGDAAATTSPIAVVPPRERSDAAKLGEALKAEQLARALRIYEARESWSAASIEDRQLVLLAKAAARAKKLPLAQRLLEEACGRGGRSAGQAWLALAQLHGDALGRTDHAREIYRKVIDQYPGSDVAKLAALQLDKAQPIIASAV